MREYDKIHFCIHLLLSIYCQSTLKTAVITSTSCFELSNNRTSVLQKHQRYLFRKLNMSKDESSTN